MVVGEPDRTGRPEGPGAEPGRDAGAETRRESWILGLSPARRAVILALVVCALALSVAVPLRNYLGQRGELAEVQQQQQRLREQVDELERQKADLQDPAQIEAEARRRLRYVRPGETPYIVQLPDSAAQSPPPTAPNSDPAESPVTPQPWYSDLWGTVGPQQGTER